MSARDDSAARGLGIVLATLVVTAVPAALGCRGSDGAELPDAGTRGADDAGGLASLDAAPPPADLDEGGGPDALDALACFDGRDQDGDTQVDCADSSCATAAVCCVGSTDARCCQAGATIELPFAGCSAGVVSACAALAARVVSGSPLVSADQSVVLVSAASVDAAVDFPELETTPRAERVTIRALVSAPVTTAQLDATAFGLWSPRLPSAAITPLAAVVVSATRGDVSLLVGSRVIDSVPLPPGATQYTLVVEPSGRVTATFEGAPRPLSAMVELPAGVATPVLFGRVQNDSAVGGTTRVLELSVERSACDLPAALVRSSAPVLADGAGFDALQATDPSVLAFAGSATRVAFVAAQDSGSTDRAIWVGELGADGLVPLATTAVTLVQLSAVASGMVVTDLGGPHLYRDGATISMYFAFETDDDRWRLARLADLDGMPTITVLPAADGSFDDPALMPDGRLIARERLADGGSRLVLLELGAEVTSRAGALCASETDCPESRSDDYVHGTSPDPLAFDHDEVRAPAVLSHDGVARVYFAGRRGTRWSIGMLVMGSDPSYFRVANGGLPVLAGGGTALDTLGAAGPAPYLDGDRLTLLYAGTDGAHWRITSASQPLRGL